MKPGWIILIVIVVLLVLVVGWLITSYNKFVGMRNKVEEGWRQVDVELHRRHDLIPNLVETVRGYASHESSTLQAVIQARAAAVAPGTGREQQAAQENMLTQALGRLMAVAEQYPQLQANENFRSLMGQLSDTENRIANGRRYYNALVNDYNTGRETFPSSIVAGMFNFARAEYFEAGDDARVAPRVSFGQPGPGAGSPMPPPSQTYPQQGGQFQPDSGYPQQGGQYGSGGYPPAGPPQQQ